MLLVDVTVHIPESNHGSNTGRSATSIRCALKPIVPVLLSTWAKALANFILLGDVGFLQALQATLMWVAQ